MELVRARLRYSWLKCQSGDSSTAVKLQRWSESHHLIATVGKCAANVRSMAAAGPCVTACIWPHWSLPGTIPSCALFICDFVPLAKQPSFLSPPPSENSLSSLPPPPHHL